MKKLILGVAMMAAAMTASAANYLYWTLDFSTLWSGTELTSNPLLQPGETHDVWLIAVKTDGSATQNFTDDSYPIGPTITSAADANIGGAAYSDVTSLGDLQYWTFAFAIGNWATGDWSVISEKTGYDVFKKSVTTDPTEIVDQVLNGAADTVWHYLPLTLQAPAVDHGTVTFYTNGVEVAASATPGEYIVESNSTVTVICSAAADYAFTDGATALTNVIARVDADPFVVEMTDVPHWSGTLYMTANGLFKDSGYTEAYTEEMTTWSIADSTLTMTNFAHPGKLIANGDVRLVGNGSLCLMSADENEKAFTAPDVDTLWVTVSGANPATNDLAEAIWDETSETFLVGGKPAQRLVFAVRPTSTLTVPAAPEGTKETKVFVGDEEIKPNLDGTYSIPSNETVRVEYTSEPGKFFDGTETKYVIDDIDSGKDPIVFPTEKAPAAPIVHTHCVCGKTACGHDPSQVWTCVATLPTAAGYYVLTNDVVLTETYHPADGIFLCLAGHTITNTTAGQAVITNDVGEAFTLVDCTKVPGAIQGDVKAKGEIDLNGGTIDGDAENVTNNGGEVGGTTKGGTISGGDVPGDVQDATVTGGTIGGTVTNSTIYGGVYTGAVSDSTVYGGVFTSIPETVDSGSSLLAIPGTPYYIVGKNLTVVGGRITSGTFTFNPTNAEYAATGIIPLENVTVNEIPGSPTTWNFNAAVVLYVADPAHDPAGSDTTGNGSVTKPFATLQKAYSYIQTEAIIALLSDIQVPAGATPALTIADGKNVTLTTATASGLLLTNAAGVTNGLCGAQRGANTATLVVVTAGQFTLRQAALDGQEQAGLLVEANGLSATFDTNTRLVGSTSGALVATSGTVTMKSNATITDNIGAAPAVALSGTAKLKLAENVILYNNRVTSDGAQTNVLAAAESIILESALGADARIGVSIAGAAAGTVVAKGTGSYTVTDADARHFLDDTGAFKLVKNGNAIVFAAYTTDDDRTLSFDGVVAGTNLILTLDKAIDGLSAGDFVFTRNGVEVVPENVTLTVTDGTNVVVSVAGVDFDGYTVGIKILNGGVKVNGGAEVTKFYTTHVHDGLAWQAWEATDSLPTTAGNYFLKNDVTLTAAYAPVDGVNLCLNGKTITQGAASTRVIDVGAGVTFGLYDCQDAGAVTGGAADMGAGVSVAAGATFDLMGGAITGNVATACGGGVYALGTVRVGTEAVVLDNLVAENADNLCLGSGSALTVLGNTNDFAQTIGLSTDPLPTATAPVAINCTREADDLALRCVTDKADTVIRQRLDGTFELAAVNAIDPASGYQPNPSDPDGLYHFDAQRNPDGSVTLSGYWKTEDPTKTFTVGSYTGGFRKEYDDMTAFTNKNFVFTIPYEEIGDITEIYTIFGEDDAVTYAIDGVHDHCLCGDGACTVGGHVCTNLVWRKWREIDSLPTAAGNYFLAHDVTLTDAAALADGVNLCLYGRRIIQTKDGACTIKVAAGSSAVLTDCQSTPGAITHATGLEGVGLVNDGRFTMYGGSFRDNVTTNNGGAICTQAGAVTVVYGGRFTGNTAAVGGALAAAESATNCVYGGTFVGNTATRVGGAIYPAAGSTVTFGGAPVVTDNTVGGKINNLWLTNGVTVAVSAASPLVDGAQIGVTTEDAVQPYRSVAFTANGSATDCAFFAADKAGEEVAFAGDHLILQVPWIKVQPENLTNATYQVLTNGAPVELTGGSYLVPSNGANVVIVYTPNAPYCFDDGTAAKTNAVDTSTDPTTNPPLPAAPSVKLTSASDLAMAIAMLEDEADGCTVKWYVANDFTVDAKSVIAKNGLNLTIISDGHTITAGTGCPSIFELVATNGSAAVYTFANANAFADNRSEDWKTTEPLVKIVTDGGTVTLANPGLVDLEPVALGGGSGYSFHQHYVCGEHVCAHTGHEKVTITWKKWTSTNSLPATAGSWYLDNDVKLDAGYAPADGVELCLNGHIIDVNGQMFSIADDVSFGCYECRGTSSVTNGAISIADNGLVQFTRGEFAAVSGGLVVVPNEMTNVVFHAAFSPLHVVVGTNAVVKMGTGFALPEDVTVAAADDLMDKGAIKILEPAAGVTFTEGELAAFAAKVVPYDPDGIGFTSIVQDGAIWLAARFTITYDAMNGTWADGSTETNIICYVNTGYELPTTEPTREDHEFIGWYASWTNGAVQVTDAMPLDRYTNHTIVAKWKVKVPGVDPEAFTNVVAGSAVDGGAAMAVMGPKLNASGAVAEPFAGGYFILPERVGDPTNSPFVKYIAQQAYDKAHYDDKVDLAHKLRRVTLSTYLTRIGDKAFQEAAYLTNVTFVTARDYKTNAKVALDVGTRAFEKTAIEKLVIPAGVTVKLRAKAFANCAKLKEICVFGDLTGTETAPFNGSGTPGEELLIRLSPALAADVDFVAKLTANLNTSRVKISSEPLGTVAIESINITDTHVTVTFKVDLTSPWGVVNKNTVALFYTDDLEKGWVGTGKVAYPNNLTGPDANGVYTADFYTTQIIHGHQFYRLTIGAER